MELNQLNKFLSPTPWKLKKELRTDAQNFLISSIDQLRIGNFNYHHPTKLVPSWGREESGCQGE